MVTHYLFEDPIPLMVVLFCLAFALFVAAGRVRKPKLRWAALIVVLAGIGVFALAFYVNTDREIVEQRTRDLVLATAPVNAGQISVLVDPDAAFLLQNGVSIPAPRPLGSALANAVDRFGEFEQGIKYIGVEQTDTQTITTKLGVRTVFTGDVHQPINTEWLLTWRKGSGGAWRVMRIEWVKIQGQQPSRALWQY